MCLAHTPILPHTAAVPHNAFMPCPESASPGAEPRAGGALQAATLLVLNLVLAALLVPLLFLLQLTVQAGTAYEHVIVLLCLALGLLVSVNWSAQTQSSLSSRVRLRLTSPRSPQRLQHASGGRHSLTERGPPPCERWHGKPTPA